MAVLAHRFRLVRALFRNRRSRQLRRQALQVRSAQPLIKRSPTRITRRVFLIRANNNGKEALPELTLFKQLESELESLGSALVKIQQSRVPGSDEDETLLSTLIEEVQQEQEAWYQQVQVMERLISQAATLENGEVELQELRQKYDELRKKVELYNGLLSEREREVDSLKQQLQDVNTAAELKELRSSSTLKELVATGGEAIEEDLRLPTWSTEAVSTFLDKVEDVVDVETAEKISVESKMLRTGQYLKRMELPGLAVVSVLSLLSQVGNELWKSATAQLPREVRALVEVVLFCAVLGSGVAIASHGTV